MAIYQDQSSASLDTIQVINAPLSASGIAWGSTIQTTFTATGQTLTLPTIALTDIGKSISVNNVGTNSFLLAIASGTITTSIGLTINPGTTFIIKAVDVLTAVIIATNSAQAAISEFGELPLVIFATTSAVFVDVTGGGFTLPSAGIWQVEQFLSSYNTIAGVTDEFRLVDTSNVVVANSICTGGSSGRSANEITNSSQSSRIITIGSTSYKLQMRASGGTSNLYVSGNYTPKITWQKISGTSAVNGQLVESTFFKQLNTQGLPTNGTPLNFESIDGTTPLASATTITLTANRQYYIHGAAGIMSGTSCKFSVQFFNVTTGLFIGTPATYSAPSFAGTHSPISGIAAVKILPTVTTQIQLRVIDIAGTAGIIGGANLVATNGAGSPDAPNSANWVKVTQEGSAAYTVLNPVSLTTQVTGILPIANGGTNATTANAAINNLLPAQASNAAKALTTDGTNATWQLVVPQSFTTTVIVSSLINVTNSTYLQLAGLPAGTYDVNYRITLANTDTNNRIWATGVTINNGAQSFSSGADGTTLVFGSGFSANHPFTCAGYQQVVIGAGGSIEIKGQIYGTQTVNPAFAGVNRLTATRVA